MAFTATRETIALSLNGQHCFNPVYASDLIGLLKVKLRSTQDASDKSQLLQDSNLWRQGRIVRPNEALTLQNGETLSVVPRQGLKGGSDGSTTSNKIKGGPTTREVS